VLSDVNGTVFLFDVDNTLLDNDQFKDDLRKRLLADFGLPTSERYWSAYDALRDRLGYVDYIGALQSFGRGLDSGPELLSMSSFLLDYRFTELVYPRALDAIRHVRTLGTPAILSDGELVFQPRKIQRSGIFDAVEGRVMITLHKEQSLPAMRERFPASHYVMVDDKPQLLAAMKKVLGKAMTTVFVRQGHYAAESAGLVIEPPPDRTIERIGDLCDRDLNWFHANTRITANDAEY
jgi:FMN phosphatase YigB (HAD superfamily)